ncbi:hypothetical protein, partial [Saccharospirillum sp.]|uniref:hypothetical protein n=1 Tax=Saccharospirillum sp. TaxID=2033801 RepID=UPI0034A07094
MQGSIHWQNAATYSNSRVTQYFPEDTQHSPEPETYLVNPAAMEDRLILTDPYAASGYIGFDYYTDYQ